MPTYTPLTQKETTTEPPADLLDEVKPDSGGMWTQSEMEALLAERDHLQVDSRIGSFCCHIE